MSLPFLLISSIFILNSLQQANGVNLSPGCGKTLPEQPRPGKHHKFSVSYQDKILGDVERNYIIQIPRVNFGYEPNINDWIAKQNSEPQSIIWWYGGSDHECLTAYDQCYWTDLETAKIQCLNWEDCQNIYQSDKHEPGKPGQPIFWARGPGQIGHSEGDVAWTIEGFNNQEPTPLVLDLHGYYDSASNQINYSPWKNVGLKNNFILVWPDGPGDSPNAYGSWNCSRTDGPLGAPCDLDRNYWGEFECHYSCPLCNPAHSCDWSSCYDDLGFLEFLMDFIGQEYCLDLNHIHLSGISNGGMLAYFVMATATDGIGIATFNPMAASPLIGFGDPPENIEINFSILDMHGLDDDTIPYNSESIWNYGTGPHGSLISQDGYFYEEKFPTHINKWSEALDCDTEQPYFTPYDGQNGFQCFERQCSRGNDLVRCFGQYSHDYPFTGTSSAAEVAWEFMKNHPRN